MPRVSNREIKEEVGELRALITETLAEGVSASAYVDPIAPTLTLSNGAEYYTLDDVRREATASYVMFHGNPLFKRAVDLKTQFVFGRGCSIDSPQDEVKAAIVDFLERNTRELGHLGLTEKDKTLTLEGNLFLMADASDESGAVMVHQIPMSEITESRRDPNAYRTVWFWKRTYTEETEAVTGAGTTTTSASVSRYHPALGYEPDEASRPREINGIAVDWQRPIHHAPLARVGREVFAIPPLASGRVWATSYSHFLSDIRSIAAALSRFAAKATAKTPAGAKALQTLMDTESGDATPTASVLTTTDGITYEPVKTAGVMTNADEGRRFMLMFASAADTPEPLLACDPSTGNLATAKSMERPFELSILERQRWWEDLLETLVTFAVACRVRAADFAPLEGTYEADDYGRKRILVNVTRTVETATNVDGSAEPQTESAIEEAIVQVTFPSVLEHDMEQEVTAIIDAATLKGLSPAGIMDRATLQRMLLAALNLADPDDAIADMDQEDLVSQTAATPAPEPEAPFTLTAPTTAAPPADTTAEEVLADASNYLREAVQLAREAV